MYVSFFLFERTLDGIGWGGEGEGRGGEGLLNFHFIFQKTWAEPGKPS